MGPLIYSIAHMSAVPFSSQPYLLFTSSFYQSKRVSWGGVRLSPPGTSATVWPIVPAPDDE
jgi:hypothetical protein